MAQRKPSLLLFDGVCNFCNDSVLFVLDRDPHGHFVFASLQSDVGQRTLREHGLASDLVDSVVLVEDGKAHIYSSAALRVARGLRWPWPLVYFLFVLVPRPLRDWAYKLFARHRYTLFGKSEVCRIPTPELRSRMLA